MTPDFILGVDPGLGGALALFDARSHMDAPDATHIWDTPVTKAGKIDLPALAGIVAELPQGTAAIIENVSSRPRQAGAFNFGFYTGVVHGALAQEGIPIEVVPPVVWKRAMGLGRLPDESQDTNKDRARAVASKLFPHLADQFKRKRDDGRAEALLLALYFHHKVSRG